ncbi:MAG: hypothetical protein KGV44_05305 [Flavobacteriaceae bacterium]|nr:hypothetical protein [Flavobacteriaceae bacterium]
MLYKLKISPIARGNVKDAVFYYATNASEKVAENFKLYATLKQVQRDGVKHFLKY